MEITNNNLKHVSGRDILHHTALWLFNWEKEDFKKAFKDFPIGATYHLENLQNKLDNGTNTYVAVLSEILTMDIEHQTALFDYLFNERYKKSIQDFQEAEKIFKRMREHKLNYERRK